MRALAIAAALLLVGCASPAPVPSPTPTPMPASSMAPSSVSVPRVASAHGGASAQPQPDPQGTPTDPPSSALDAVRADLATRDVDASSLVVVSSRAVTWADASLGCPEPGVAYNQALVPGLHLVVEANSVQYDYRIATDGPPRLCVPLPLR